MPTKRRRLYIMTPFLLLLLCLGGLNLVRWFGTRPTDVVVVTATAVATHTPVSSPTEPAPSQTPRQPVATAVPNPSATPYVPPSYSDNDIIQLLGPPSDSTFASGTTVSFYWQWPRPLSQDQFFTLYFVTEDDQIAAGTVPEANVGDSYRLHVDMAEVGITAVSLQWQVHLNTTFRSQPLRTSQLRSLQFLTIDN